nr:DUF1330 domain-containing protein [Hyphomonas sp. Mor2]
MRYLPFLCVAFLVGCSSIPPLDEPPTAINESILEGPAATLDCNRPVYLVVQIADLDRSISGDYAKALRDSKIVARNGGKYLMVSPPTQVLEGEWQSDGFVVESYPCREAFEAMWYSDEYQNEIKPLREGSGVYTIGLFDSWRPLQQDSTD